MESLTRSLLAYKQVKRLRLHGMIARELGIAILSGEYRPDHMLVGEEEACRRLQVSRSSYREAVRILASKGLVSPRTRVGTRICRPTDWHLLDPEVLAWSFGATPDRNLLSKLFELRAVIGSSVAGLAALRRGTDDLGAMKTSLDAMACHSLQTSEGRKAVQDFHAALLRASGNPYLAYVENSIREAVETIAGSLGAGWSTAHGSVSSHTWVFNAVAKGDAAKAKSAMESLIRLTHKNIASLWGAEAAPGPAPAHRSDDAVSLIAHISAG